MDSHRSHFSRQAFSLIELAMVLVISGMMVSFGLQAQQSSAPGTDCYATAKTQLMTIRTAVEAFARKNDRLPMPASLAAMVEDTTYGREGTPATTTVVGSGAAGSTWGAVPFQALGLAPSYASDCWGDKIVYVVTTYLVTNAATNGYLDTNAKGTITLKSSTTNTINTNTAYAVISLGEDKLGAVKANGSAGNWCTYTSANIATYNCSANSSTIVDAVFNNGKNAGVNYYDDVIVAAGKPPVIYKSNLFCWGNDASGTGTMADGNLTPHMTTTPSVAHTDTLFAHFGDTDDQPYASKLSDHNCALGLDGTAYCWGGNSNYGLGNNTTTNGGIPKAVNDPTSGPMTYQKLIAVGPTQLAIGTDGKSYCWGLNYGVCLTGNYKVPTVYAGTTTFQFFVDTIDGHMGCGLGTDNIAYCWSWGGFLSTKGRGMTNYYDSVPTPVSGSHKFSKLVGVNTTDVCGLTTAADPGGADYIYCWGGNSQGTLGVGDQLPRYVPTVVPGHTFSNLFIANNSVYGIGDAADANPGRMYAWGFNSAGLLGVGGTNGVDYGSVSPSTLPYFTVTNVDKHSPGTITTSSPHGYSNGDIVGFFTDPSIASGAPFTGITLNQQSFLISNVTSNTFTIGNTDGTGFTIEYMGGPYAATSTITNITNANPAVVTTSAPHNYTNGMTLSLVNVGGMTQVNKHTYYVENATANTFEIWSSTTVGVDSTAYGTYTSGGSAGNFVAVAKKPNGCYFAYLSSFGICKSSPTLVDITYISPNSTLFTNVVGQNNTNIGLTSDGKIYGWGQGYSYQIGSALFNQTVVSPKLVPLPAGVVASKIIAESWYMGCTLATNKNIYCWGQNSDGEAGNGTTSITGNPTIVSGGNQWIDFSMPQTATECAIKYNPLVDCDTTVVTWGACGATSPAMVNGATQTITNTSAGHTGSATYSCTNQVLTQTSNTCM